MKKHEEIKRKVMKNLLQGKNPLVSKKDLEVRLSLARAGDIILVPHSEVYPDAPAGCDWQWVGEQGLQTILKAVPQPYTEEMNRD